MHQSAASSRRARAGFTLVELLVVIAIIGVLVALLLPAVQAAREAARRIQCRNHLKQFGVGLLVHESTHARFPSGGWGFLWVGDPDRGFDRNQPGGWVYNLLPYIDQFNLHQLGAHQAPEQKRRSARIMAASPPPLFYCPSRREARNYPTYFDFYNIEVPNSPFNVARIDYAINAGDSAATYEAGPGPPSLEEGDVPGRSWPNFGPVSTGLIYVRSEISLADVHDGTSNTYFVGEKYLDPEHYEDGRAGYQDQCALIGDDYDINAWTALEDRPRRDTPGLDQWRLFGSAHASSFHIALCDGSVQDVSYDVDPETHRRLGNRRDGLAIAADAIR